MLQQDTPEDFVLASGRTHSVRHFVELAFRAIGVELEWSGTGVNEVGRDAVSGAERVKVDPIYFRPTEVDLLLGDASKARQLLGWKPTTTFEDLVSEMVMVDLKAVASEANRINRFDLESDD